jgi:hypothetical protein
VTNVKRIKRDLHMGAWVFLQKGCSDVFNLSFFPST